MGHQASSTSLVLHEAIIDLYLQVKVRSNDEVSNLLYEKNLNANIWRYLIYHSFSTNHIKYAIQDSDFDQTINFGFEIFIYSTKMEDWNIETSIEIQYQRCVNCIQISLYPREILSQYQLLKHILQVINMIIYSILFIDRPIWLRLIQERKGEAIEVW